MEKDKLLELLQTIIYACPDSRREGQYDDGAYYNADKVKAQKLLDTYIDLNKNEAKGDKK